MSKLTQFQDAFEAALRGDTAALAGWLEEPEPAGLSVYRNTVCAGTVDALAAGFPTVVQIVGAPWFQAAAAVYAAEVAPKKPSLMDYGSNFPKWLSRFSAADDTPYIGSIAEIDRLWWEAHFAADAELLRPNAVVDLGEADLEDAVLILHPSVRLARFDENLVSLWLAHQGPRQTNAGFQIETSAEQLLISRCGLEVKAQLIDRAAYTFLSACLSGRSLIRAAESAAYADPSASFPMILSLGFEADAFRSLDRVRGAKPQ